MRKTSRRPARPRAERPPGPVRTCVVTREAHPAADLIHLVLTPEGEAVVDRSGKAPGRGAWVTPTREILEQLERRPGVLHRALEAESVRVDDLVGQARAVTLAAALDLLSLCARSGRVASGADQVRDAARAGQLLFFVAAVDASPKSVEAARSGAPTLPVLTLPLDRDALGHRVGKGARAVLGIRPTGPSEALLRLLRRLASLG